MRVSPVSAGEVQGKLWAGTIYKRQYDNGGTLCLHGGSEVAEKPSVMVGKIFPPSFSVIRKGSLSSYAHSTAVLFSASMLCFSVSYTACSGCAIVASKLWAYPEVCQCSHCHLRHQCHSGHLCNHVTSGTKGTMVTNRYHIKYSSKHDMSTCLII